MYVCKQDWHLCDGVVAGSMMVDMAYSVLLGYRASCKLRLEVWLCMAPQRPWALFCQPRACSATSGAVTSSLSSWQLRCCDTSFDKTVVESCCLGSLVAYHTVWYASSCRFAIQSINAWRSAVKPRPLKRKGSVEQLEAHSYIY